MWKIQLNRCTHMTRVSSFEKWLALEMRGWFEFSKLFTLVISGAHSLCTIGRVLGFSPRPLCLLVPQICPPIYLLVCPPSANPSCIHLHPIHSSINRWLSICCACAQVYTFSYTHTLDLFSGRNVKYERKWIKRGDWKKRWME